MLSAATPYKLFDMTLKRRKQVTPSMVKFTFTANDMDVITFAPDQRVKLFFPANNQTKISMAATLALETDWYSAYRKMAIDKRPAMRTYTIRAVRSEVQELDIEFVLHGDTGPASRWASRAMPGDAISINAPNSHYLGKATGYEWSPPVKAEHFLLIADETALPAVMGIIEQLDARFAGHPKPRVQALLEVPLEADCRSLPHWIDAVWLPRETSCCRHGEKLELAVRELDLNRLFACAHSSQELAIDVDKDVLWDVSEPEPNDTFYAWVASESKACLSIRRYLVNEMSIPKRQVSAMGYWRRGKS